MSVLDRPGKQELPYLVGDIGEDNSLPIPETLEVKIYACVQEHQTHL